MKKNLKKIAKIYSVKDKGVIRLSDTLQKFGFSVVAFSDGLINKEDFLSPCIVLAPIDMPKTRLNSEKESLKKYFGKFNKKKVDDFTKEEYTEYLNFAEKEGETEEYIIWRRSSKEYIHRLIQQVRKFNSSNKNKFRLSILKFTDGLIRLDFGDQKREGVRHWCKKLPLKEKKKIMENFFRQMSSFEDFLSRIEFLV